MTWSKTTTERNNCIVNEAELVLKPTTIYTRCSHRLLLSAALTKSFSIAQPGMTELAFENCQKPHRLDFMVL